MASKSEMRKRYEKMHGNFSEQAKELAVPVVTDLVGLFAGAILGKIAGRPSLIGGMVLYGAGKFHTLHEQMDRDMELLNMDEQMTPALSGFSFTKGDKGRIYHGESPLTSLGMGMMLGGAFGGGLSGPEDTQPKTFGDKMKSAFDDLKADLGYRLYLDKLTGKKDEQSGQSEAVNGTGDDEVKLFLMNKELTKGLDTSDLDTIEQGLHDQAHRYQQQSLPAAQDEKTGIEPVPQKQDQPDNDLSGLYPSHIM